MQSIHQKVGAQADKDCVASQPAQACDATVSFSVKPDGSYDDLAKNVCERSRLVEPEPLQVRLPHSGSWTLNPTSEHLDVIPDVTALGEALQAYV
jgi:hypothetical protein